MVQKWISCPKWGFEIKFSLRMKYSSKIKFGPNEITAQNWNGESITIWHWLKIASQNCLLNREAPPFVMPYCWLFQFLPHINRNMHSCINHISCLILQYNYATYCIVKMWNKGLSKYKLTHFGGCQNPPPPHAYILLTSHWLNPPSVYL